MPLLPPVHDSSIARCFCSPSVRDSDFIQLLDIKLFFSNFLLNLYMSPNRNRQDIAERGEGTSKASKLDHELECNLRGVKR